MLGSSVGRQCMGSRVTAPPLQPHQHAIRLPAQVAGAWVEVYSDGSTFYSRAGHLDILCKFQGLVSFPFDRDVRRPLLDSPALASYAAQEDHPPPLLRARCGAILTSAAG